MLGCYRRDNATDPDTYVLACSLVLASYDADIVREVTDPRTGIQTTAKFQAFPPNAGELKAYCDTEVERRRRLAAYQAMPQVSDSLRLEGPGDRPGSRANLFVGSDRPRYAEMVERTKSADAGDFRFDRPGPDGEKGVWISLLWWHKEDGVMINLGTAARAATGA